MTWVIVAVVVVMVVDFFIVLAVLSRRRRPRYTLAGRPASAWLTASSASS